MFIIMNKNMFWMGAALFVAGLFVASAVEALWTGDWRFLILTAISYKLLVGHNK